MSRNLTFIITADPSSFRHGVMLITSAWSRIKSRNHKTGSWLFKYGTSGIIL